MIYIKFLILIILLFIIPVKATNTSTIVMDIDSNRILYQDNAYEKKLIASITKIMTFVVSIEHADDFLDAYIEAGDEILPMYGTSIYISYKEEMKLKDLLYGLMLRSGNDASVVIAKFVAGSEENFVKLMNDKAKKIGMNNTIFNNPHGLDEKTKNYSTAYDMALLSIYASKIPFYMEVTSTKYYKTSTSIKAYSWLNRNNFLFMYKYATSGKTGYTPSAGKTFVSTASNNNLNLTIVSLNDPNTYQNHKMLYEEMFNKYHNYLLVGKGNIKINDNVKTFIKKDIIYPLTKEEYLNKISKKIIVYDKVINNIYGEYKIYLNNKEILTEKIYIDNNYEKKLTFFERIKRLFKKIY